MKKGARYPKNLLDKIFSEIYLYTIYLLVFLSPYRTHTHTQSSSHETFSVPLSDIFTPSVHPVGSLTNFSSFILKEIGNHGLNFCLQNISYLFKSMFAANQLTAHKIKTIKLFQPWVYNWVLRSRLFLKSFEELLAKLKINTVNHKETKKSCLLNKPQVMKSQDYNK